MILSFLVLATCASSAPTDVQSRITSLSIFRQGLAVVTREVDIPAGKASYRLDVIPEAVDGGFWYGSPDGAKIRDVRTKIETVEKTIEYAPRTVGDYMAANVGKRMRVAMATQNPKELEWIEGVLTHIEPPPQGLATIKSDDGNLRIVNVSLAQQIDMKGLDSVWKRKIKTKQVHIEFEADAPKPARVRWTTLEFGPAWSPSYLVELQPGKEAELTAKVQLGLPGWTLKDTDVQLLAGKPTVKTDFVPDLMAARGTIGEFLARSQSRWTYNEADPFAEDPNRKEELSSYYQVYWGNGTVIYGGGGGFVGGGGFGGGGFGGGQFGGDAYRDTRSTDVFAREPEIGSDGGVYTYPLGKLSMGPGERLTRVVFEATGHIERIIEWQANANSGQGTLADVLELTNSDKLPWTGGRCIVLHRGTPLAMTQLPFTTSGSLARVEMGSPEDLKPTQKRTVEPSDPIKIRGGVSQSAWWHTTAYTLKNTRDEPITVRFAHSADCYELKLEGVEGVVDENSGTVSVYSTARATFSLKPGDIKEIRVKMRRTNP